MKNYKAYSKIYNKNFGIIYNFGVAIFSWIFFFFLKDQLVLSAKVVIFFPDEIKTDIFSSMLIFTAIIFELGGIVIKIKRIRHIKTKPEEYSDFYKTSSKSYISDFMFFHFLLIFSFRLMYSLLLGYIFMSLLGYKEMAILGSFLLVFKDILFFKFATKDMDKPLEQKVTKLDNLAANILLLFSGFVFLSVIWQAFGQRFNETLCTITNWQGLGDFILGIILLCFFYFMFFHPTRIAFHIEELEFVDNSKEEKKLMLYYFYSILFAITPWLI